MSHSRQLLYKCSFLSFGVIIFSFMRSSWRCLAGITQVIRYPLHCVTACGHDIDLVTHSWLMHMVSWVHIVKEKLAFLWAIATGSKSSRLWKWVTIIFLNRFHKMPSNALMVFVSQLLLYCSRRVIALFLVIFLSICLFQVGMNCRISGVYVETCNSISSQMNIYVYIYEIYMHIYEIYFTPLLSFDNQNAQTANISPFKLILVSVFSQSSLWYFIQYGSPDSAHDTWYMIHAHFHPHETAMPATARNPSTQISYKCPLWILFLSLYIPSVSVPRKMQQFNDR